MSTKKMNIKQLKDFLMEADKAREERVQITGQVITSSIGGIPFEKFKHIREIIFDGCEFQGGYNTFQSRAKSCMSLRFRGCKTTGYTGWFKISSPISTAPISVKFESQPGPDRENVMNEMKIVVIHGHVDVVQLGFISADSISLEIKNTHTKTTFSFFKMKIKAWLRVELKDSDKVSIKSCQESIAPIISTMFPGIPVRILHFGNNF